MSESRGGAWASSSQDYVHHATELFRQSTIYSRSVDGNCSPYTLSAVPVLLAGLRAMLIEANAGIYGVGGDDKALSQLASATSELAFIKKNYALRVTDDANITLLYEVRNEILHPAHMPAGTTHGTPVGMIPLRNLGLLQSTGDDQSDYTWISQLQSHRLFRWAFVIVEKTATIILARHHARHDSLLFHLSSYGGYREHDLHGQ